MRPFPSFHTSYLLLASYSWNQFWFKSKLCTSLQVNVHVWLQRLSVSQGGPLLPRLLLWLLWFTGVRSVAVAGRPGTRTFIMHAASASAASDSCRSFWLIKVPQGSLWHFWRDARAVLSFSYYGHMISVARTTYSLYSQTSIMALHTLTWEELDQQGVLTLIQYVILLPWCSDLFFQRAQSL